MSSSPFCRLDSLPATLDYSSSFPKPLRYTLDSGILIISTNAFDKYGFGVFKYDINTNQMERTHLYNDGANIHSHGHFIDNKNGVLYIFGGLHDQFTEFRLKQYVITYQINDEKNHKDIAKCGILPCSTSVSSSLFDYIYIAGDKGIHFKFNIFKQSFITFNVNRLMENILYPKLLYIPYTKQLMIAGGDNDDRIWISDVKKKINQIQFKWKINDKLKMPHKGHIDLNYDVVLFGDILFAFYFKRKDYKDIFCLDLLQNKWFQSKYNLPTNVAKGSYVILSGIDKNKGYLLDFQTSNRFKVNLCHLVPKEMINSRIQCYKLLIMGWMKQQEKKIYFSTKIPFELIQIICKYFPWFPLS